VRSRTPRSSTRTSTSATRTTTRSSAATTTGPRSSDHTAHGAAERPTADSDHPARQLPAHRRHPGPADRQRGHRRCTHIPHADPGAPPGRLLGHQHLDPGRPATSRHRAHLLPGRSSGDPGDSCVVSLRSLSLCVVSGDARLRPCGR
jgi:hypothetical protein